jgi:hypothetical protein
MGMTIEQAKKIDHYMCSDCVKENGAKRPSHSYPVSPNSDAKVSAFFFLLTWRGRLFLKLLVAGLIYFYSHTSTRSYVLANCFQNWCLLPQFLNYFIVNDVDAHLWQSLLPSTHKKLCAYNVAWYFSINISCDHMRHWCLVLICLS